MSTHCYNHFGGFVFILYFLVLSNNCETCFCLNYFICIELNIMCFEVLCVYSVSEVGQLSPRWLNSCGKICIDLSRQMLKTHFRLCMCGRSSLFSVSGMEGGIYMAN